MSGEDNDGGVFALALDEGSFAITFLKGDGLDIPVAEFTPFVDASTAIGEKFSSSFFEIQLEDVIASILWSAQRSKTLTLPFFWCKDEDIFSLFPTIRIGELGCHWVLEYKYENFFS